jgi:cytochrome o ubiquinol oxidase subunit III
MKNQTEQLPTTEQDKDATILFGFWMYLMSDFLLFAGLFATYAVLRTNTFGGPSGSIVFNLPFVLTETVILLTSSFTSGLSMLAARKGEANQVLLWLISTMVLGITFVTLEFSEFARLIAAGNGPQRSGFLSSYFTLVGVHGLHVLIGVIWMVALIISIRIRGLTRSNMRKLATWNLFWHFLEVIWIFIFAIVYLLAVIYP